MLINGEWKKSSDGKTTSILDPSNNQPIAEVERGNKDDARAAVDAARQALKSADWREIDPSKRGRMLYKMANLQPPLRRPCSLVRLLLSVGYTKGREYWSFFRLRTFSIPHLSAFLTVESGLSNRIA